MAGDAMNGLLDRCIACGMPATKPGSGICIRCEIMALIALGYERMRERVRGNIKVSGRVIVPGKQPKYEQR